MVFSALININNFGDCPEIGWVAKLYYVCFWWVIPLGGEKYISNIPRKSWDNPVKSLFMCFSSWFFCSKGFHIMTFLGFSGPVLSATTRLSQRYLHIPHYGVLGVSIWRAGVRYPSPHMRTWGAMPANKRGISAILARDHMKTRQNVWGTPLQYYLNKALREIALSYPSW